jgi:hypothetical protein
MEMILLDWTRMAKSYCLAGAVAEAGSFRVVRPLLARIGGPPQRQGGWSAYLVDGYTRWEVFELIGPTPAVAEPPHLEDLWVRGLKRCGRLAPPDLRRAILDATTPPLGEPLFGAPLATTRTAAYLPPGTGRRSLATLRVPAGEVAFGASWRGETGEPDFRVALPVPGLDRRTLPVKDHHLLLRVGQGTSDLEDQIQELNRQVRQMGAWVAVRLGLSRAFQGNAPDGQAVCWLMADGFFSLTDPQP